VNLLSTVGRGEKGESGGKKKLTLFFVARPSRFRWLKARHSPERGGRGMRSVREGKVEESLGLW